MSKPMKCPCCGDVAHLYMMSGPRWNPGALEWTMPDAEEIECTSCDWQGYYGEAQTAAKESSDDDAT